MRAAGRRPPGVWLPPGGLSSGMHPPLRRRKVRSAPFPPAAKAAPAPLLLLSPPRGARRGPLFGLARKENGPCTVQKKRALSALRCSGPPRDGGRRIGACSDFAWPSGTLCSSARSILPSRGGWCGGRQGGYRIDQLLFSLPRARWLIGLLQRADEGIGPYGDAESHCPRCRGGRPRPPACIGPPRPPGQRVAKRNARKEDLVKCVLAPR